MAFLAERELTRKRYSTQGYGTDGRPDTATGRTCTFRGSVQPLPERDRQVLPEGVRHRDGRKVYAARGTLRTANQHDGYPADRVRIDDVWYEVVHVDAEHRLIPHDRAFVLRIQEAE
jgi:hypothetical protein